MPAVQLTKRWVDAVTVPGDYSDAGSRGLTLRVSASGQKLFRFRYRLGGRGGRLSVVPVGAYGAITLEQARQKASALRDSVSAARDGRQADPAANRKRVKASTRAEQVAPTVAELADAFLAECAAKLKPSTVAEYRRLFGVVPVRRGPDAGTERAGELRAALGRHKVADVTRAQVAALHLGMQARPYMANRALAALSALLHLRRAARAPAGRVEPVPPRRRATPSTSASAT